MRTANLARRLLHRRCTRANLLLRTHAPNTTLLLQNSTRSLASTPQQPQTPSNHTSPTSLRTDSLARFANPTYVYQAAKETATHYYHGSKLLAADTKIAAKLTSRLLRGANLTRREHTLLVRVLSDLLRVVPLAFFVIVPFMEFALPFAIRLFPTLLPSTFEEKHIKEERKKGLLKVRLSVAQVLEDTLEERAVQLRREREERDSPKNAQGGVAAEVDEGSELRKFMKRLRQGGPLESSEEMLQTMGLFRNQLTLDALNRRQLVSMCQFLEMRHFGPNALLRFRLGMRLRQLRKDDKDILWEGVSSLTKDEVVAAMRARGLPTKGLSDLSMRNELQEWLSLSQNKNIPSCMMILANMFRFARVQYHQESQEQGLVLDSDQAAAEPIIDMNAARTAISSLSDTAVEDAISDTAKTKSPAEALKQLQREEALIEEERKASQESALDDDGPSAASAEMEERLSREQLRDIAAAVETMSATSALKSERETMVALECARKETRADVESSDSRAVRMLDSRVQTMMDKLRHEVEDVDGAIGVAFRSLDLDGDGVLSQEELLHAMSSINFAKRPRAAQFRALVKELDPDSDGKILISDLQRVVQEMSLRDSEGKD